MFSKRSVFNCLVIFAVLAGLGACQPPPATTPPDTVVPDTDVPPTSTLPPTATQEPTPIPGPPAHCREEILNPTEPIHAVHMGGNWGTNFEPENTLPEGYFEYLRDLNVNWVGISVGLHYDDSMDSTVERIYSGVQIPTFTDYFLREMIRTFHQHGFCVYLTLSFEGQEAEQAEHPLDGSWLGNPTIAQSQPIIRPEFWPWAIDHPDHERFVAEFWQTYTEQTVHFGQLAEEEGVALYSLGTESDSLFRTRPSDEWSNDFGDELHAMVSAVREVYSGALTYDMVYEALVHPEWFGFGYEHLWEDLDLDTIGLSAYFPLVDSPPNRVLSVAELEQSWETIFQDYLIPMHAANPDRPIYFTEFGAADSVISPYAPNEDNFVCRFFRDADGNGLDDGEETQANIYQALFNVMNMHPGVVNGVFTWEMWMASNEQWVLWESQYRSNSIRDKLAEDVLRAYYGAAPRATRDDLFIEIPPPFEVEESLVIYDDALGEGWEMWAWDGEVDPSVESVVHSGRGAMGVTLEPGGGFAFINPLDISEYAYLEFYVNGGSQGGQELAIHFWDVDADASIWSCNFCRVISSLALPPDEWVLVRLPLQDLGLRGRQVSININSTSDQPAPQFFLDDIRLVKEAD